MSRYGLDVASSHGATLPKFSCVEEAERALYSQRDSILSALCNELGETLNLDYSPDSLKRLEQWFFEKRSPNKLQSGVPVAKAIAVYFGEVLCRHGKFKWIVKEFAFAENRYELGVSKELCSIMLTNGRQPTLANNKRMQSLWREFAKYAS
jgi:hypothetical protein